MSFLCLQFVIVAGELMGDRLGVGGGGQKPSKRAFALILSVGRLDSARMGCLSVSFATVRL